MHRRALRKKYSATVPWFQPRAQMSVAVVLYGKVGTFDAPGRDVGPDDAIIPGQRQWQRRLVEESHASFVRHVVDPNPGVALACFAHSWNPSLGPTLDKLYAPVESLHERERMAEFNGQVHKSALTSIRWALAAKRRHERKRGKPYDLAMLLRYDLAFHSPWKWPQLERAQLWALAQCCPWKRSPVGLPTVPAGLTAARAIADDVCLGKGQGAPMDYCRVSTCAHLRITRASPTRRARARASRGAPVPFRKLSVLPCSPQHSDVR